MCWRVLLLASGLSGIRAAEPSQTVKVFILAGQSNMEGKAPNTLLDHQATDPKTKDLFAHLRKDDKWIVRDDVFIKFLDRKGPLTVGYGSPGRTGVELEFGTVMGDHFEEPVLLIKTAWGGHSLYKHFRSPSAGYPAAEVLQKELDQAQANVKKNNEKNKKNDPLPTMEDVKKEYGSSYRNMMAEVKDVMDNYATMFPALKGKKLEVAGFVWFQGWNDQYGAQDEYESNMKHFIQRRAQGPEIAEVAVRDRRDGPERIEARDRRDAHDPEGAARDERRAGVQRQRQGDPHRRAGGQGRGGTLSHVARRIWSNGNVIGGDHAYHYLGSAIWFNRIGKAMGEAMLELMKDPK